MLLKIKVKDDLLIGGYTNSFIYNKQSAMWRSKVAGDKIKSYYYIPGSSLRGAIREKAEQISNSLGGEYKKAFKNLFGKANFEGKIAIGSALARSEKNIDQSLNTIPVTRSKISRTTRTTSKNALFTEMPSGKNFELVSKVTIYGELTEIEEKLFKAAVSLTDNVGSNKSIGKGGIEISIEGDSGRDSTDAKLSETGDYILVARPIETFRITQKRAKSYFYDTYNYIPGTTLRGAFAKIFDEKDLNDIIKDGNFNFPNLYPSDEILPVFPAPLTSRTIKGQNDIYTDLTIPYIIKEFFKDSGITYTLREKSKDGQRLNPFSGYCYQDGQYLKKSDFSINTSFDTHISLSRATRTTKKGLLWTYMTVHSNKFVGRVHCEDSEIIKRISKVKYLRIGGSKNRGYGLVEIDIIPLKRANHSDLVAKFNDSLKAITEKYLDANPLKEDEVVLPIIFASDALLPFEKTVQDLFKEMDAEVLIKFIKHTFTYGYNTLYQNDKNRFKAISMGSLVVLKVSKDKLNKITDTLYKKGVGLRTLEGYGRIEIISPLTKNI